MNQEAEELQGLREAFAVAGPPDDPERCPPPERIWAALRGELSAGEIRDVVDHTAACAACAEDWRLAAELLAGEAAEPSAGQTPALAKAATAAPPRPRRTIRYRAWYASLAAAALIVLAVNVTFQRWKQEPSVARDSPRAAIESTLGSDPVLPREQFVLRWKDAEPGATYEVKVSTEGFETIVLERGLTQTQFRVPPGRLARLQRGTRLLWQVEASRRGGDGRRRSETYTIRIQ